MRSSWILLVVLHVAVLIHTGHSSCTVQIEKDRDFVLLGKKAQVNCTSNCPGASWETRLAKGSTVKTDNFTSVEVQILDYEDSPITCLVVADDDSLYQDTVRVEAYALPSKVDIDLKEELEEDKEHEVICSVDNVAPVKNVILSVTKGGEPFLRRTFENDARRGLQNLRETFNFTASRRDNLQDFACQVTLNLTRVANTTVQSSPVTVSTFTLPENPRITAEKWMEQGTVTDISCEVLNAFPTENVTTRLFINHSPTLSSVSRNASVSYTLNTSDLQPALYEVVCESQVFSISKRSYKQIIIYEPPKVNLTVSSKVVTLKDRVTIDCNLAQGNAEYFGLSINSGKKVVERVANLTAEITITKREPTLSVTCETFIAENGKVLLTSEEILTVHYPPLPPSVNISTSTTSPGGSVNLSCHSDSHPSPTYSWIIPPNAQVDFSKDNSSITIKEASTYHNGTYTCQVRNDYGNFSAIQSLEVKYDNTLWIALVGVVVGVLAAAIIGLVSYFLLQNGKKGFYDLVRRKHKSPDSAGIPLHENGKV